MVPVQYIVLYIPTHEVLLAKIGFSDVKDSHFRQFENQQGAAGHLVTHSELTSPGRYVYRVVFQHTHRAQLTK